MQLKSLIVLFLFALMGLTTSANVRIKRRLFDCKDAISECNKKLEYRIDWNEKIKENLKTETPDEFECCYYAEFENCVDSSEDKCSGGISSFLATLASGAAKTLRPKCENYSYPSAKCIFFVWFYCIIGIIAAIILLSIICCIARCICCRRG